MGPLRLRSIGRQSGQGPADLWRRCVACFGGYERYAETVARDSPIVILEPIAEGADA